MLVCYENIRQTNEKTDECVLFYKTKLINLEKGINEIYKDQSVIYYILYINAHDCNLD